MTSCRDSGSSDDPGGQDTVPASGSAAANFVLEMFGDFHYSTDDLYELVWQGGGIAASSPTAPAPPHTSEVLPPVPPTEDEMAAWLYPIITGGQERAGGDDVTWQAADDRAVPAKESNNKQLKEELPTTETGFAKDTRSDSSARRKTVGGARSNHAGAHSQTEKRRRSKINERLRTLQELVPGCDKSNQASTLDQTIQYLKSLQQQVQAMSVGRSMRPAVCSIVPPAVAIAAGSPMPPAAAVAPGTGIHVRRQGVVPFVPVILCPAHHPAVMMPAPLIYRPAAAPSVAHAGGSSRSKKQQLAGERVNSGLENHVQSKPWLLR